MRFWTLLRFLIGARDFARLDPNAAAGSAHADQQQVYHRKLVRAGTVGLILGIVFGVVVAIAMILHPSHEGLRADDIYITLFELLLMPIVGILTAVGWVCAFLPAKFYRGPIGEKWLKLLGTTNVTAGRFVSLLVGILGVGLVAFFGICITTGHV